MEWIDIKIFDQKKLGKGLGEMHLNSTQSNPKIFGYPIEGFIGLTDQKKGWEKNWIDCFLNLRIIPQLSIIKSNFLDKETINKVTEKIRSELLNHKPINTLIHGDLWSGNVGIDKSGRGVIFDPASWWADNEVDIAMTKLFGGFRKEFYEEYNKIFPVKKGFEKRIIIYNFYHILNHANMFGGSYFNQVKNYVKSILKM
jgi:fructosamine-3-kinase